MARISDKFIDILATDAEASEGANTTKAITPKQLKDNASTVIDLATTATAGIVRIATDTEAAMGENVIAVVKPSHILRFIWDKFTKWTQRTLPVSTWWRSICWSPELGLFCAVATNSANSSNIAATSPDGINWTQRTLPVSASWLSVCWSPELGLFCAVAANSTIAITSPNGINWTQRTLPVSANWQSICWSPELRLFCAIAIGSTIAATYGLN